MPRPKLEINPIRGKRLKEILTEQKITQKQLAEKIHISQQSISAIVNDSANLTESTAKAIIELFPSYRYEWLMGYDDFQTEIHKKLYPPVIKLMSKCRSEKAVESFLSVFGLSFQLCTSDDHMTDISIEEFTKLPESEMSSLIKKILSAQDSNTAYEFRTDSGEVLFRCSTKEKERFIHDICDYAEFKMNQMIDQKGTNNG